MVCTLALESPDALQSVFVLCEKRGISTIVDSRHSVRQLCVHVRMRLWNRWLLFILHVRLTWAWTGLAGRETGHPVELHTVRWRAMGIPRMVTRVALTAKLTGQSNFLWLMLYHRGSR